MDKLIITAALTGGVTVPSQTQHLPYIGEHIAGDAIACGKAGAAAVHIHARDPQTAAPSSDPKLVKAIATQIKQSSNEAKAGL